MSTARLQTLLSLALGTLLVGCAGLAWHRVFPTGALLEVVAVAALAPTLLVVLWSGGGRRSGGLSLWLAVPASVAAWLIVVGLTLLRPGGLASAPGRALMGVRDGWFDLLLMAPPAPPEPRLLVGIHALVWLAAYATAEVVLRTRAALLPVLPGFAVLLVGVSYGVGGSGTTLPLSTVFLAVAITLVLVRHAAGGGRWAMARCILLAVPWVACVAGFAALLGPAALLGRDRQPFNPRHLIHPPGLPQTAVSPLDQVSSWLSAPGVALFTVAASAPENWRIAVLDRFDGRTWRTDGRFLVTEARVPVSVGRMTRQPLHQVVTIDSLTGPWLPAAASPVEVAGLGVLADPDTGVLLSRTQLQAGLSYEVISHVPRLTADQIRHVVAAPASGSHLDLPTGLPDVILRTADTATTGARSPFEQAQMLERYLRTTGRNDPTAAPGHAYGHLAHFLGVSHRGTSEQFATAFAVMARSLGLPSRVVVGFRPGTLVSPGMWQVRGADALVWPEVAFSGLGWVPFFPTPSATAVAGESTLADGQSQQREELDRSLGTAPVAAAQPQPARPPSVSAPRARPTERPAWWWAAGAVGVAGLCYVVVVLLAPLLRTYRRRRLADPSAGVAAAWRETVTRLQWVGVGDDVTLTTEEVADVAAARLGPSASAHLAPLAELADEAAFSGWSLDRACGVAAWAHRDRLSTLVSRRVGRVGTLRRRLSPWVLRG